jgi:ATP-dependent DNA ligase
MLMFFHELIGKLYPQRAKGLEPEKLEKLWNDKDYTYQVKKDGDRRLLYFTKDKVINTSRSKGADTGLPVDKTNNTPHIRDLNIPELEGTIIDSEFIHNRGFQEGVRKIMGCLPEKAIQRQNEWGLIEVYAFDIICYKGKFLIDEPLWKRLEYLKKVYEEHFKDIPFFHLYKEVKGNKQELIQQFEELVASGGEGFVGKHLDSTYRLSTEKCLSPLKNAWIKIKREFNGDFVVMGFEEPTKEYTGDHLDIHPFWESSDGLKMILRGQDEAIHFMHNSNQSVIPVTKYYYHNWIGGIKFGEYENDELMERGTCSGMTEEIRADISNNKNYYLGKVIEIDGMERIKKTKAIRQPVFKRFRDDKEPNDCQYKNQKG